MTTPALLLRNIIDPVLPMLALTAAVAIPSSDAARLMLLAIPGQESDWRYRLQKNGPARSFWQFEGGPGSGLVGLFGLYSKKVEAICAGFDVPFRLTTVFEAVAWHDQLACSMARLLLWSDPAPLPAVGDAQGAWAYYLRCWGPGMPHPDKWAGVYATSLSLVKGK